MDSNFNNSNDEFSNNRLNKLKSRGTTTLVIGIAAIAFISPPFILWLYMTFGIPSVVLSVLALILGLTTLSAMKKDGFPTNNFPTNKRGRAKTGLILGMAAFPVSIFVGIDSLIW